MTDPVFLNAKCHAFNPYSNLFFSGPSFELGSSPVQDLKVSFLFRDMALNSNLFTYTCTSIC